MNVLTNTIRFICSLFIALLIFAAPDYTWAQNVRTAEMNARTEPYFRTVRIHTVKRDQIDAWESLMKERRDAEEAAGRQGRQVFQRLYGQTSTYLILTTLVEDPPAIEISPTWFTRLASTLNSSAVYLVQMYREHEVNLEWWLTRDTDLLYVRLRTNAANRTQDYHDWQTEKLYPMLKEAGVTARGGRVVLGGNIRTWVRFAIAENFESLYEPNPVIESRQFERMYAEGEEMVVAAEDLLYQYRGDLSFRRNANIR
jgi:hypothetical protein